MSRIAWIALTSAGALVLHESPAKAAPQQDRSGAPDRPEGVMGQSLLEVEVGGDAIGRTFDYVDGLSGNLRSYKVAPAAMLSTAAAVYPFADAGGVLGDIGLTGSYARSFFLDSALAEGGTVGTTASAYSLGLRLRIHPWGERGVLLGVSDEYAVQSLIFDSAGATVDGEVPSVDYQANRTAVDARIPVGSFAVLLGAGVRAVLSAGDVASRFRAASVAGVDGELGLAMPVARHWEGRLVFDYERYFYAFKPIPGDAYVAGGALDQFFGGRIAVAYIF